MRDVNKLLDRLTRLIILREMETGDYGKPRPKTEQKILEMRARIVAATKAPDLYMPTLESPPYTRTESFRD